MVYEFGMSDDVGPLSFVSAGSGRAIYAAATAIRRPRHLPMSEATAQLLDAEVAVLVHAAHARAASSCAAHRPGLERLATVAPRTRDARG